MAVPLNRVTLPDADAIVQHAESAAGLLKALANPNRLQILCVLGDSELSVGALNEHIPLSQSALSQHLAVLREQGLVDTRRQSQIIHYRVMPGPALEVIRVLHRHYCSAVRSQYHTSDRGTSMLTKHLNITRFTQLADDVWTAGQPSAEQLRQASEAGLRSVVNLCPAGECGWDEKTVAETLGLRYVSVPIGAACDLGEDAARRLHEALESCPKPVLVHCASSNRVGALFALKAHFVDGRPPETALEQGRRAGLTGLEGAVRQILS